MHLHAARLVPAPHFGEEEENPLDVDSTTVREGLHAEECKFGMGGFYLMVALGCGATQLTLGVNHAKIDLVAFEFRQLPDIFNTLYELVRFTSRFRA